MSTLTITGLHKRYGGTEVLKDIHLSVADGEFVVFVGPSGCGKSTLLRLICGLDEVSAGTIAIDGMIVNDVPSSKRGIAMVFQSYALYPHMTVAENMGYALRLAGVPKAAIAERVAKAAAVLKVEPLLGRKPRQLSGGQRQRVAIGRAIVREPKIFLFDEPLSNLDAALRVDMRMEFARLKGRLGTTMVYVTHDQVEAMTLADKIVVMNAGRIEQVGSPKMNFLPVAGGRGDRIEVPGGHVIAHRPDRAAEVGIRPEHIVLSDAGTVGGTVIAAEHLGSDTFAYVEVPGAERAMTVRIEGEQRLPSGAPVRLTLPAAALHFFAADGAALTARAPAEAAA
jgi:ABC-type sugar transport system ATPase subunit